MKINRDKNFVNIETIKYGCLFEYNERTYMKVKLDQSFRALGTPAVNMSSGNIYIFSDVLVKQVDGELVI